MFVSFSNNVFLSAAFVFGATMCLILVYFLFRHWVLTQKRKGEAKILPAPLPYLGHVLEMGQRPVDFLLECSKKTQEIFGILLAGQRMFVVSDVHSSQTIIKANKDLSITEPHGSVAINLFNIPAEVIHSPLIDTNLVRKWFTQYLLNDKSLDLLCSRMMRRFSDIYRQQVAIKVNAAQSSDGCEVQLYDFIARFVFHIAIGAIYSSEINDSSDKCDQLYEAFRTFDQSTALCLAGLSIQYQGRAFESLKLIQSATNNLTEDLSELITRRSQYFDEIAKQDPAFKNDNGRLNSPIFWASVSNSMPGVFWLIFHIIQKPSLLQQIREEIQQNLPNYERFYDENFLQDDTQVKKEILTIDQLNSLLLVDACFTEALRMYSGSFIVRTVMKDGFELQLDSGNQYNFRKGDRVALFPAIFHYDEEIFPNPREYDPSRFLLPADRPIEERIAAALGKIPMKKDDRELNPAFTFLAFGAGVTYCPGRRFIRSEVKLLFIFLVLNLEFELKGDVDKVVIDPSRAGIGIFPPLIDIPCSIRRIRGNEKKDKE